MHERSSGHPSARPPPTPAPTPTPTPVPTPVYAPSRRGHHTLRCGHRQRREPRGVCGVHRRTVAPHALGGIHHGEVQGAAQGVGEACTKTVFTIAIERPHQQRGVGLGAGFEPQDGQHLGHARTGLGPAGALRRYGSGQRASLDKERV